MDYLINPMDLLSVQTTDPSFKLTMPRKSICWDTYTSEVVVLDSSDDDEVPKRTRKGRIGARKTLISSAECSPENLTTSRENKFRIHSESSSESDDCVVYSSDEEQKLSSVLSRVKDLTLPKFSYETPDKKTSLKNKKLLSDISNHCGTPLKPSLPGTNWERKSQKGRSIKGQRNSKELKSEAKAARENRLFDALLGVSGAGKSDFEDVSNSANDGINSLVKVNDSYNNAFLAFHDIIQAKSNSNDIKSDLKEPEKSSSAPVLTIPSGGEAIDSFKKPTTCKKQKEISNKVKRPGDSRIVSRRTDDSDSTDCSTDNQLTPRRSLNEVKDLVAILGPRNPSPDPWDSEPVLIPSDPEDFYVKESPKPPIKKKGKAITYCFSDLKTALDDIEAQGRDQLSFLISLNCCVTDKSCHPTAQFYKERFTRKKEELAVILFKMFNKVVFDLKLPEDMPLEWSGRMTSSAGITHLSRKMVGGEWQFHSRITLSKPIVTTASRLRDTLIHEMCHAAVWLLDRKKDGHGSYWKAWTYKAREAYPDLLPINTCHSYSRDWKFTWECISCGYTIGRMTKSFNTQRFSCGRCHGRFELKENKNKAKREANGFAKYVKENYASIKSGKGLQHKEVMKVLSQQYQSQKTNTKPSLKDTGDGVELISSAGDDYDYA